MSNVTPYAKYGVEELLNHYLFGLSFLLKSKTQIKYN